MKWGVRKEYEKQGRTRVKKPTNYVKTDRASAKAKQKDNPTSKANTKIPNQSFWESSTNVDRKRNGRKAALAAGIVGSVAVTAALAAFGHYKMNQVTGPTQSFWTSSSSQAGNFNNEDKFEKRKAAAMDVNFVDIL
jgi:hypothetical protein